MQLIHYVEKGRGRDGWEQHRVEILHIFLYFYCVHVCHLFRVNFKCLPVTQVASGISLNSLKSLFQQERCLKTFIKPILVHMCSSCTQFPEFCDIQICKKPSPQAIEMGRLKQRKGPDTNSKTQPTNSQLDIHKSLIVTAKF